MAAANFSRDVLENFYGEISHQENQRLRQSIRPNRRLDFEIEWNEFNQWLRVWKVRAPEGNKDILKFLQKTKNNFIVLTRDEVQDLKSAKVQFGLLVRFSINRNREVEYMEHYFNRMQPIIINEHNIDTLDHVFNQIVDVGKRVRMGGRWNFGSLHQCGPIPTTQWWQLYAIARKTKKQKGRSQHTKQR